jgi:amino acid transporter
MIFIFYAYGGWHEMAYVGAEVRNPERNILRAVVLGTLSVTAIYVLVNLAFLKTLGFAGTQQSQALAADVLRRTNGAWGARLISLLICVSALGVINGQIFTGARIYYAMGPEHRLYAWLGRWNPWLGTPVWSLLIQAGVTLGLVIGFGLIQKGDQNGFQSMVTFTTPVFWIFMLLVGIGLFVLRYREPDTRRPYRVPGYPLVPLLFCGSSLFMIWKSLDWAVANRSPEALWSIVILAVGLALSCYDPKRSRSTAS